MEEERGRKSLLEAKLKLTYSHQVLKSHPVIAVLKNIFDLILDSGISMIQIIIKLARKPLTNHCLL